MAQTLSVGFYKPTANRNDGNAVCLNDILNVTANPTVADTLDFRIPKGIEVSRLKLIPTDMDTGAGLAGSWGFAPITGTTVVANGVSVSANLTYFRAAGAFGQSAGGVECDFLPITFEDDVYLRFTPTVTSAGFVAGTIAALIIGNQIGVR